MTDLTIPSDVTGSIWKILVKPGDQVSEDDTLIIMESMKMEIPLSAPEDGVVKEILVKELDAITDGQPVLILGV